MVASSPARQALRFFAPWLLGMLLAVCEAAADDSSPQPQQPQDIRLTTNVGTVAAFMPERWGELRLTLTNPGADDAHLLSASYLEPDSNLQFGRRIWLPGHARMRVWHPIRVPRPWPGSSDSLTVRSFVAREGGAETTLIRQDFDALQRDLFIRANDRERWTALVDDRPNSNPGRMSVIDLLQTARYELNMLRTPIYIADRLLPATQEGFDPLDHFVVADDRVASDPAGLAALRSWLFSGGHLWVMLDRVRPEVVATLLGNDFACQVVDRVGLTEVQFQGASAALPVSPDSISFELPVEHVRMVDDGFEVLYRVNGWPAALTRNCGQGTLLVTTLAADGWVQPRVPGERRTAPPHGQTTDYLPSVSLMQLMKGFFAPRETFPLSAAAAETHVRGYIGYSIPTRQMILGVLAAFTGLLAIAGLWLTRGGRLEWLGVIAPVAGLLAGAILIQSGYRQRTTVPSKAALVQMIQPQAGTQFVSVTGEAGLYLPQESAAVLQGAGDGWILPEMSGQEQTTRRLIWIDLREWHWENMRSTPSLRFASFHVSAKLDSPLETHPTLNDLGLVGQLALPENRRPTDAVLLAPAGRMAVTFTPDGRWTAAADQVLTGEEFLKAGVLSDEQHRRLETLRQLMEAPSATPFPRSPTLVFWTEPWNVGLEFSQDAPTDGAALVAVPVTIERPAPGSRVTLPAPWLPYREAAGPDGSRPSGFFDNRKLTWTEKSRPTSTWLRFLPPPNLIGMRLQSGVAIARVSGPVGKLELAGFVDGQVVPIRQWIDPIGTLRVEISDPALLYQDAEGGILLRISGGDPDRPELTRSMESSGDSLSYWRIESLSLDLTAVATAPPSTTEPVAE